MPSFNFVARDANSGSEILNCLEAASVDVAINTLLKRNLLVVSIEETLAKRKRASGGKVALRDLVAFTRHLATMVDAGMALLSSLKGLAKQTRDKEMRDVIRDMCARIESGASLSEAMAANPKVFNQLYLCMISGGEKGGLLGEVLGRLATYLENTARLQRKVKSALMYPVVVSAVAVSITIFLLIKVVPVFGEIFDSFKGKLPAPTLFLIEVSNVIKAWFIPILFAVFALVYGWLYFIKTKPGREFWDKWRIKLPIFGSIALNICLARFTRTFSSLVRSGVPILGVMQTVSKACGNVVMEKAVNAAAEEITTGSGISDALAKYPVFPDMLIRMMAAGEETGKIDDMMERIANSLDEEIEVVLAGLSSLIEPILIVFLGVMVGGIAICMFLPIFKLSTLLNSNH